MVGVGAGAQPLGDVDRQRQAGPGKRGSRKVDGSPDRGGEVEVGRGRVVGRGVAFRQDVERLREAHEALRLLEQRVVRRPFRRHDAVAQGLEIALEIGERRPELVRRVGDEVAPDPSLLLEARGHLVEGIGEAHELLRALARHAGLVVPVGDAPRGCADVPQRFRQPPRERDGHDAGDQRRRRASPR